MIIRNKFNGYSADGRRLCHDPGTIAAIGAAVSKGASVSGAMASVAAGGGLGSLGAGITAGNLLAGGAQGLGLLQTLGMSPLGGMASLLPQAGTTAASTLVPQAAQAAEAVASNQAMQQSMNQAIAKQAAEQTAKQASYGMQSLPSLQPPAPVTTSPATSYGEWAKSNAGQLAQQQEAANMQSFAEATSPLAKAPYVSPVQKGGNFASNFMSLAKNPSAQGAMDYIEEHPYATAAAGYGLYNLLKPKPTEPPTTKSLIRPYEFTRTQPAEAYAVSPTVDSSERTYFTDTFTPLTPYEAPGPEYKRAAGGLAKLAVGGPVETMSAMNSVGGNMMYPQAGLNTAMYSNPMIQRPEAVNVIAPSGEPAVGAYTGEQRFAGGGISNLGGYSDGGRLLKGPGDGVSDSIPAVIGERQPARLADGEFVVPARIVSEIGNGSTEAGARKLYAMMDRVQKARRRTVGKDRVATNTKSDKYLPA